MQESPQASPVITSMVTLLSDPSACVTAAEVLEEIRSHDSGVLVIRVPVHITSALLHGLAADEFRNYVVDLRV